VSEGKVKRGVEVLKGWGLDVVVASNVLKEDHTYAGTVEKLRSVAWFVDCGSGTACIIGNIGIWR